MQASAAMKAQQPDIVVCYDFTPSSEDRTNHDREGYLYIDEGLELAPKEHCHDVL